MMHRQHFHRRRHSGGFVMIIAVLMLGIVGAALAVLTTAMNNDGRRTANRQRDAQLEQMLLAASADAPAKLASNPPRGQSWKTNLPAWLADEGATLTTRVQSIASSDQATLFVRATLDRRLAEQTIQLHRDAGKWHITSMHLSAE